MKLESQVKIANLRFQGAEAKGKEVEERAKDVEAVARAVKVKEARAIEEYKKSTTSRMQSVRPLVMLSRRVLSNARGRSPRLSQT